MQNNVFSISYFNTNTPIRAAAVPTVNYFGVCLAGSPFKTRWGAHHPDKKVFGLSHLEYYNITTKDTS